MLVKKLRCLESPKLTLRSLNFAALDRIFYDYTSSPSWMQQETGNDKFVLLRSSISALSSAFTLFWLFYFKTFERKQVLTTPVQIVLFLFVQSVPITFAPSWGDPYIIRVTSNTIRCLFVSIWQDRLFAWRNDCVTTLVQHVLWFISASSEPIVRPGLGKDGLSLRMTIRSWKSNLGFLLQSYSFPLNVFTPYHWQKTRKSCVLHFSFMILLEIYQAMLWFS